MAALVIPHETDYGAPELRRNFQKFATRGFLIATLLHFVVIGTSWVTVELAPAKGPRPWAGGDILLYPAPPIGYRPNVPVQGPPVNTKIGIPVAVPGDKIDPDETILEQREGELPGFNNGGEAGVVPGVEAGPPPDFVAVQKDPIVVKRVKPEYPEFARRAGVEGTVYIRVWVDREGRVRAAEVLRSTVEILNQAAVDAAMQWVFEPALMNNGPVDVWVAIPFRFTLKGE